MRASIALCLGLAGAFAALSAAYALDLNAYRRAHHRPPLQYSGELAAAAQWHAGPRASKPLHDRAPLCLNCAFGGDA